MDNLSEAHVSDIKLFCFCSDKVPGTSEAWNSQAIKPTYFLYLPYLKKSNFCRDKLVWPCFITVIKVFPCDNKECRRKDFTFERAEVIRWWTWQLPQSLEEIKQRAKHNMASLFQIGCFDCENKVQMNEENKIWCTRFLNWLLDTWVFENTTLLAILA